MRAARLALWALAAVGGVPRNATAQQQALADPARLAPFRRDYRMTVDVRDSIVVLGDRTVSAEAARFAGEAAWLVVERRGGVVPAIESLFVSGAGRPIQWSATLGASRLVYAFVRDSIFGAVSTTAGRQNVVHPGTGHVVVSTAMVEMLFRGMALEPYRTDSVGVLVVDRSTSLIVPGELSVIGEDLVAEPSASAPRPAWIVVLRAEGPRTVIFWVDKADGALLRLQQPLPVHAGSLLEYRPATP